MEMLELAAELKGCREQIAAYEVERAQMQQYYRRAIADRDDAKATISRLRAELAEARKPDCRRCSYHYACAKLKRYPCDNGEDFVLHNLRGAVRLYEKEGE